MKMNFEKLLIRLNIVQEVDNEERREQGKEMLGRGYFKARRFNRYNPLSYVLLIIAFVFGVLLFGFIGVFKGVDNPFKWN